MARKDADPLGWKSRRSTRSGAVGAAVFVLEAIVVLRIVGALVDVVLDAVAVAIAEVRLEHDADERARVRIAALSRDQTATGAGREERVAREVELHARDLTGEVTHGPAMPPATPPVQRGPDLLPPLPATPVATQTALPQADPSATDLTMTAPLPPEPAAPAITAITMENPAERQAVRPASPAPQAGRARWQVQLGAFRSGALAHSLITSAKTRLPSLAKYTVRSQSHGEFTTVRAGPITSREEAVQLCAKLRSAKQACVVVKA